MLVNLVTPNAPTFMQGINETCREEFAVLFRSEHWKTCFTTEVLNENADLVLIIAYYRDEVYNDWIKNLLRPNSKCLIGIWGKAVTEARKWLLENVPCIDFVICGDPEDSLLELSQRFQSGNYSVHSIDGIATLNDHSFIDASPRKKTFSYDTFPLPTLSYLSDRNSFPICVLSSSSGCHGNCSFCEGNIHRNFTNAPTYRAKSADRVLREIEYVIAKYNRRVISFSDDNFLVDGKIGKERAEEIAKKITERKLNIRFTIECRADDVDHETFALLHKAGLYKVFIGIESGSQSVLDRYNKGITVEQNQLAINTLHKLGIKCEPGYILFDPATTLKELHETYSFLSKNTNSLFAPMQGGGRNQLYFIHNSPLLKFFWPHATSLFYDNVVEEKIPYPYLTYEAKRLCENYGLVLKTTTQMPNENMLEYRLRCIKILLNKEGVFI